MPRRYRILACTGVALVLSACSDVAGPEWVRPYTLDQYHGALAFPAPADSMGVVSGQFHLAPSGNCERVQIARYFDGEGGGLVELESRLECRWESRGPGSLDIIWDGGSTWGYDDLIEGTDSALVADGRFKLFIHTGVVCFSLPCPTAWIEEYR